MYLAIINNQTDVVENIIVPPEGAQAFFLNPGYYGVMTDQGNIGDTYDETTQVFVRPPQLEQPAE